MREVADNFVLIFINASHSA